MTAVRLINTFILRQRMREVVVQPIFPSMSGKLDGKVVSYIHTHEWCLYNSINDILEIGNIYIKIFKMIQYLSYFIHHIFVDYLVSCWFVCGRCNRYMI